MSERWAPVKGYEGRYEVSDTGLVRSLPRMAKVGGGGFRLVQPRLLKQNPSRGRGYVRATVNLSAVVDGDGQKTHKVATLVAQHFMGAQPGDKVRHIIQDPFNNAVGNLVVERAVADGNERV